jgi:hypothetical protein
VEGDALVFTVVLGVLAYIAGRLLERMFGPFPEEPDRGVEPPWRDPPWWWFPDEEESRWPWDPFDRHPFDPFDDDRRR